MSKYSPLNDHLKRQTTDRWDATFLDIEKILGFKLPRSAETYQAWWSNDNSPGRHATVWLSANWRTHALDLSARRVSFVRLATAGEQKPISSDMVDDIVPQVSSFFERLLSDTNHRFRSWEHCYNYFSNSPHHVDRASLHLAFYLASWGMYRGSGFLIQKDYKVHADLVSELIDPRYRFLHGISIEDFSNATRSEAIDMIFELVEWIKQYYKNYQNVGSRQINVSDTLATKILLGTLGCVPAYDRFFRAGLKRRGIRHSSLSRSTFGQMLDFCLDHKSQFLQVEEQISTQGTKYPFMKLVDMYFWSLGEGMEAV